MILDLLEKRTNMSPLDDFWYKPAWMFGSAGSSQVGDPEAAMGLSAWWNALTIISGTIGSLPLHLYRRGQGDDKEKAVEDPRYQMMNRSPTPFHTAMEWMETAQGLALTRGNFYALKIRDDLGRVRIMQPIHPDRVVLRFQGGELIYEVKTKSGPKFYDQSDVFHLRGFGSDGYTGASVFKLARRSLSYSMALEQHGDELMTNKARPGGVLSTDQVLKKETRQQLKQAWDEQYTGGGIGKTAVLDAGLSWQTIGLTAEDSQFIESRQFQIAEIARWMNIAPHFLKDLSRATYSNIEQQSLDFVIHTVRPWAERWEQRLDNELLAPEERGVLFFKFDLNGLLRGDTASRSEFYRTLFQLGSLSPNEIRHLEDMNSVDGGDQRFVQLNLVPLDQAGDPMASTQSFQAGDDDRSLRSIAKCDHEGCDHGHEEVRKYTGLQIIENRSHANQREFRSLRARRRLQLTYTNLMTEAAGRVVRRENEDLRRLLDAVEDGDVDEFLRRMEIFSRSLPSVVRNVFGPIIASYVNLVGEEAAEEIEFDSLDQDRLDSWRSSYVDGLARSHTTETVGKLTDTMTVAQGDPFDNARSMIDRWDLSRAAEIGLREATTAGAAAASVVYQFGGRGLVWRSFGESCPYCDMLDGTRIGPGERFLSAGDEINPGGGIEPLRVGRNIGHPGAHNGCDCGVSAG